MITIGITGGIGAGKSTVLQDLADRYHASVIQADLVARDLMQPGGRTYEPLLGLFGRKILAPDGTIDRPVMARAMYASADLVRAVNAIVHPCVKEEIRAQRDAARTPVVVIEAALLEEGGLIPLCDTVWFVYADPDTRIRRLMASRGYSPEKCRLVMRSQKSDAAFRAVADHTIDNSGSPEKTKRQIDCLMASCPGREDRTP